MGIPISVDAFSIAVPMVGFTVALTNERCLVRIVGRQVVIRCFCQVLLKKS